MMTHVTMFEDAKLEAKVKVLKAKVKDLTKRLEKAEAMRRPLDTMDEIAYKELEKENGDLRTSIGHRIERVEELNAITREHQMMNGKMHSEIEILKKNESLLREDLQSKDLEIGRMMKKLSKS
jgi:DNA repair exonuclease SbcCD ATPase subunit